MAASARAAHGRCVEIPICRGARVVLHTHVHALDILTADCQLTGARVAPFPACRAVVRDGVLHGGRAVRVRAAACRRSWHRRHRRHRKRRLWGGRDRRIASWIVRTNTAVESVKIARAAHRGRREIVVVVIAVTRVGWHDMTRLAVLVGARMAAVIGIACIAPLAARCTPVRVRKARRAVVDVAASYCRWSATAMARRSVSHHTAR